jgi:hypothetical protein
MDDDEEIRPLDDDEEVPTLDKEIGPLTVLDALVEITTDRQSAVIVLQTDIFRRVTLSLSRAMLEKLEAQTIEQLSHPIPPALNAGDAR